MRLEWGSQDHVSREDSGEALVHPTRDPARIKLSLVGLGRELIKGIPLAGEM